MIIVSFIPFPSPNQPGTKEEIKFIFRPIYFDFHDFVFKFPRILCKVFDFQLNKKLWHVRVVSWPNQLKTKGREDKMHKFCMNSNGLIPWDYHYHNCVIVWIIIIRIIVSSSFRQRGWMIASDWRLSLLTCWKLRLLWLSNDFSDFN